MSIRGCDHHGVHGYRALKWGTGALDAISQILRKELPGLRGFSAIQLRDMRLFYEAWQLLDSNSSATADELQMFENENIIKSSPTADDLIDNSTTTIIESYNYKIDIYQAIRIPETRDFPIEDFFNVPFTHHCIIRAKVKRRCLWSSRYDAKQLYAKHSKYKTGTQGFDDVQGFLSA